MNETRNVLRVILTTLLMMVCPLMGRAQSGMSSIKGTVTDSSGAVIPAASVVLSNASTGVLLNAVTDSTGNYSFPTVTPGIYGISVSKEGFASYRISQFNVAVGQHASQNAVLNISSTTTVEVNATGLTNLLDTESNDLGTVIGPRSVNQLPLANRNYLQLGLLSGATQAVRGAAASSTSQTGHDDVAINSPAINLTSRCMSSTACRRWEAALATPR